MNIFRLAIELFGLYLLYKLIFDFIIPVSRTTSQVKKQFGEMQERMQQMQQQQAQNQANAARNDAGASKTAASGDYIDFEEVK